jgi:hypothetical protein
MFEKLLKSSDLLSPSVSKLLHKAGLPVGNKEFTEKILIVCLFFIF